MTTIDSTMAKGKLMPIFKNIGKIAKNNSEGKTAKKMPLDREMIF